MGKKATRSRTYDLPAFRWGGAPRARLPAQTESWPRPSGFSIGTTSDDVEMAPKEIRQYFAGKPWVWPSETVHFICDVHADAEAFLACLVASGGVELTGPGDVDFALTDVGRRARFVLGGDYFDKGPSNLRLLRVLERFVHGGAKVELLAGNHDLRTMLGLVYAGASDPRHAHLFIRMGQKSLRLFREVYDEYLAGSGAPLVSEREAHEYLFPTPDWYSDFPGVARELVPKKKLEKELIRIREKIADVTGYCERSGFGLPMLHAALLKCRELFLSDSGEFGWLFRQMRLAYRSGSFLFIHAGLDDTTARMLRASGVEALNERYAALLVEDPFTLYHGPLGNSFRTKYRDIDFPFSADGLGDAHGTGVYAVIHGHRNLLRGQRIMMRSGMMNFECDASVDANTRRLAGLSGPGGACTTVQPGCYVLGVSTDHPRIKVFDPARLTKEATIVLTAHEGAKKRAARGVAAET